MNVDEDTLRRIIRSELGTELDSRFEAFESRTDKKFDARLNAFESRVDKKFDARFESFELNLAKFFGQTHRYFDRHFDTFEKKFATKFNRLQNSIDGFTKRLDDDDTERAAISNQLARHDTWVNELAQNTSTTLSAP